MKMSEMIKLKDKHGATPPNYFSGIGYQKKPDCKLRMKEIIGEDSCQDSSIAAKQLYDDIFREVKLVFTRASVNFDISPPFDNIKKIAQQLSDFLQRNEIDIMEIFMNQQEEDYLCSHSVNVTVLSAMLGVWLRYNKSEIVRLIMAAMLHDIGMVKFSDIAALPRRLNAGEKEAIGRHPGHSRDFLLKISGMDKQVPETVLLHHKRRADNTTGVNEHVQVLGICDTFEAITHSRPYKSAQEPHKAVCTIIEELKDDFDSRVIKALVDNIGIYPVGSWVKLNTGEIAFVIDVKSGFPLCPKVNVVINRNGDKLAEPKTIDLSKQPEVSIDVLLDEATRELLKETFLKD